MRSGELTSSEVKRSTSLILKNLSTALCSSGLPETRVTLGPGSKKIDVSASTAKSKADSSRLGESSSKSAVGGQKHKCIPSIAAQRENENGKTIKIFETILWLTSGFCNLKVLKDKIATMVSDENQTRERNFIAKSSRNLQRGLKPYPGEFWKAHPLIEPFGGFAKSGFFEAIKPLRFQEMLVG
nr:hypothetical protein Iba_chr07eCG1060 [Ipomoea batatas]